MIILDIETTGLNPFDCKVITIQTKRGDDISIWKEWESDELDVIQTFLKFLRTVSGNEAILGYNNLKFDIPFVIQRLTKLGGFDASVYKLLHNKKWLDLYQFLGDNYQSMETWLKKLGLSKSSEGIRGKDVPGLYKVKKYDAIEKYIIDELHMCERLFHELTKKYPAFFEGRI